MTKRRGRGGKALLAGHKGYVSGVSISPNGERIASVDRKGHLRIGELWVKTPEHLIEGAHASMALTVCWASDDVIISGGIRDIKSWDAHTGECLSQVDLEERYHVTSAMKSLDGRVVVNPQNRGQLLFQVRDSGTLEHVHSFEETSAWSSTFGMFEHALTVWDQPSPGTLHEYWVEKMQPTGRKLELTGYVHAIGANRALDQYVVALWDSSREYGYDHLWVRAEDLNVAAVLSSYTSATHSIAWSDQHDRVVIGAFQGASVWTPGETDEPQDFGDWDFGGGTSYDLSPDGTTLAVTYSDQKLRLWDLTTDN